MPSSDDAPFEMPLRVRYAECDPMGIAHHASYVPWLEMARTELLRADGTRYRDITDEGLALAVVGLEITYRSPARYDDEIRVRPRLVRMTRAKIVHDYEIRRTGIILATAATTLACLDEGGRPRRLPDVLLRHARRMLGREGDAASSESATADVARTS